MNDLKPIGVEIHFTNSAIDSYIDTFICEDKILTGMEGHILCFLRDKGEPVSVKEVMDFFHIAKATASQTLSSLVKKEMIAMKEDEMDKRKKVITLLEKGKDLTSSFKAKFDKMDQRIEEGITSEEKEVFRSVLLKIRSNLGRGY